jgi:hypothetical protein
MSLRYLTLEVCMRVVSRDLPLADSFRPRLQKDCVMLVRRLWRPCRRSIMCTKSNTAIAIFRGTSGRHVLFVISRADVRYKDLSPHKQSSITDQTKHLHKAPPARAKHSGPPGPLPRNNRVCVKHRQWAVIGESCSLFLHVKRR